MQKKVSGVSRSGWDFPNFENLDFHGLGLVQGSFGSKNKSWLCAAHNVFKDIWLVETV